MQLMADFNDFGAQVTLEGIVWVFIMKTPGPYAIAMKKEDDTPCQLYMINLEQKGKITPAIIKKP